MKTMKCDLCDHTGEGQTFEAWMENMMPHYKEKHADVMQKMDEMSPEEQEVEKKKWMDTMREKFDTI